MPWFENEKREAYTLSLDLQYKRGSLINNKKIAEELNLKYHEGRKVRTANAVEIIIRLHRNYLEAKVD